MTELEESLKPCPFCGSDALTKWRRTAKDAVLCENCGANAPTVGHWNMRSLHSENAPIDAVLRELTLACNKYIGTVEDYYIHGLWRARDIVLAVKNAASQDTSRGVGSLRAPSPTPVDAAPASVQSAKGAFAADYEGKIARDAATIKTLCGLLYEAHAFLNSHVVLPEDYDLWEKRYLAFREHLAFVAAGVAFVTDERLGGP